MLVVRIIVATRISDFLTKTVFSFIIAGLLFVAFVVSWHHELYSS